MKKLIFGVAALFMMSVVLVGCSDKKSKKDKDDEETASLSVEQSPEQQMVECMEDLAKLMKQTHLNDEDDVTDFITNAKEIKERMENVMKDVSDDYESKISPSEKAELETKIATFFTDVAKESERLQKEAADAGIDMSQFDDINLF